MLKTFRLVSKIVTIEIRNRYKWSRLGSLWVILSFAIYCSSVSIVYSRIFNQDLKEYLPYLASGLLSWTFIQSFYVEGITLYSNYKGYIVNINLPFYVYSLVSVLRNLAIFLYQIPVLIFIKIIFSRFCSTCSSYCYNFNPNYTDSVSKRIVKRCHVAV